MGTMFKRMFFFFLTNFLIMATVSIVYQLLGLEPWVSSMGINYSSLMAYCLVWGFAGAFISLLMSKFMAKMMMGVQLVDANDPRFGHIVRKVHEYARVAGISKMPEVGIYESPEPNAFATGPSKNSSLVAVSTGLIQSMREDEVEGVLAHEVAHIANGDMVTMALIQGVVNAFVLFFAKIAAMLVSNALRGDNEKEGQGLGGLAHMLVEIVFQIIFGIFGSMVVCYFSRYREFRADAGGARYAGREKMQAALKRLQSLFERMPVEEANAMSAMKISSKSSFLKLLSTHPPLAERIEALGRF
ncbi:MAG: protease HtpX [Bacteriovoracaceae bacterium]|nr:protease HtpX [Bacteriovoracaceae bacterium]